MYISNISKEEVNLLPQEEFLGKIVVVENEEQIEKAIEILNKQSFVGIDTETKPSFKKGVVHKVALLQISTNDVCFLFRLNKIGFPKPLIDFFSNKKITKIGLSLKDDLRLLNKRKKIDPKTFIDIQTIIKEYGILELSLQKIYAILFKKKISKSQRLSNWENKILTKKQQKYAAIDAWATLQIYQQLLKINKVDEVVAKQKD